MQILQDDYKREPSAEMDMYLQFDLVLSDVSALLVDGDYSWKQLSSKRSSGKESNVTFLPVIDKCGVLLKLQQVKFWTSGIYIFSKRVMLQTVDI